MSENKNVDSINNNNTPNKQTADAIINLLYSTAEQPSGKLTMDYLLGKLEEVSTCQLYLTEAIAELGKVKSGGPGDIGAQEQAKAIGEIVKAREATNQKLIALYEKMYDDLKPGKKADIEKLSVLSTLFTTLAEGLTPMETREVLAEIVATTMQDFSKNA